MILEIRELVKFAVNDKTTTNKKLEINVIGSDEANLLKLKTGFDLKGFTRIIDKSGIKHTLKKHGDKLKEIEKGQIFVSKKDFELIPQIVKSENVIYIGKSGIGADCLLYEAIINDTFYYVEEIRKGKKELCIKTLYKRKPTIIK